MGSLFTSICPSLVLLGIGEVISSRFCPKVLLLNGTHDRETSGFSVSCFVTAITDALNRTYGDPDNCLKNHGESGESGDHIVPFQETTEDYHKNKEWSQEGTNLKPTEQRTHETTYDLSGSKRDEGKSTYGFTPGSWSNAAKNDHGSELSNSLGYNPSFETAELDKGPGNSRSSLDDKEGDFVDYSWANIGCFDDLDRILRNDDPLFGPPVSLDSGDELWSSPKDLAKIPVKPFPITAESSSFESGALRTDTSWHLDIKTEYEQPNDPPNYAKAKHPTSRGLQKEKTYSVTGGKASGFNSRVAAEKTATPYPRADKAGGQKKPLKGRKKTQQKAETKSVQDFYGVWNPSGQYENQLSPTMFQCPSSSVFSQQMQFQGSEALQYQYIRRHPAYGNLVNPYPMSHIQHGEFNRPPVLSGYDVNSMNKPAKTLTPQEKIEKLRKRQQMRALLSIQKQQQQFGHQGLYSDHSVSQKHSLENQIQHVEGSVLTGPSSDPNSPLEQDDSNTISGAIDDDSVEETVLYQLQEIISKLNVRLRLNVRDSLFRLAQSVLQRNYASEGSVGNEQEVAGQKESDCGNRYPKLPDVETETNSIDRIVAHLLFQRPLDSPGKIPETSESPIPMEGEKGSLPNMPEGM